MGMLDALIYGVRNLFSGGTALSLVSDLNFKGGLMGVFNPLTDAVDVSLDAPTAAALAGNPQPAVPTTNGSTVNLLATPVPVPANGSVTVRAVVKAKIVTPTQLAPYTLTVIAECGQINGTSAPIWAGLVAAETNIPAQPWSSPGPSGTMPLAVTGAADNGSGVVRLTVASTSALVTGNTATVAAVGGVAAAAGTWTITVVDGTHLDLQGTTFSGTYTSGGTVTMLGCIGLVLAGSSMQVQANGLVAPPRLVSQSVGVHALRYANGNTYICTVGGTTASGGSGPTGTSNGQTDGTATFDWVCAGNALTVTWTVCQLAVFSN